MCTVAEHADGSPLCAGVRCVCVRARARTCTCVRVLNLRAVLVCVCVCVFVCVCAFTCAASETVPLEVEVAEGWPLKRGNCGTLMDTETSSALFGFCLCPPCVPPRARFLVCSMLYIMLGFSACRLCVNVIFLFLFLSKNAHCYNAPRASERTRSAAPVWSTRGWGRSCR